MGNRSARPSALSALSQATLTASFRWREFGVHVKAIETTYGGITFRSRLEAKWAAFFDLLGWRWEYEPFDLNGYIPDFFLPDFKTPLIVEVKPFITDAAKKKIENSGWPHEALVVGSGPRPIKSGVTEGWFLGDLAERNPGWCWDGGVLGCATSWDVAKCPKGFGLVHETCSYTCRRCGDYDGNCCGSEADIELLWRQACNATRWVPKGVVAVPVPKERCVDCGNTVTNDNLGGHDKDRNRNTVFYCIPCINRLSDEAYEQGHR